MARKKPNQTCSGTGVKVEVEGIKLPEFYFEPFAGRKPLDDFDTDLVLLTKLYRMDVPDVLHFRQPDVAELVRKKVKESFPGKKGAHALVQTGLNDSQGKPNRQLLLIGLGPASSYCSNTACAVFRLFIEQALELGCEEVTIPFIPNPMTTYTHKATAFKLKNTLAQVLAERGDKPNTLKKIRVWCTPPAVRSIKQGLQITQGDGCGCQTKPE